MRIPVIDGERAYYLERRKLLLLAAGAAVTGATTRPGLSQSLAPAADETWNMKMEDIRAAALAGAMKAKWSASSYVRFLSAEVTRLGPPPEIDLQPVPWMNPAMWFGMLSAGRPFAVVRWKMAPGAVQPAHDHPGASVCTLILRGEVEIENFEPVASPQVNGVASMALRRTRVERLKAGRTSVLAPDENNIHRLKAGPAGAEGIDFNSMHAEGEAFSYVRLTPTSDPNRFIGVVYDPAGSNRS